MYRKLYGILGGILIILSLIILPKLFGISVISSYFFSQLGIFGLGAIISALVTIFIGFIEDKKLRIILFWIFFLAWLSFSYLWAASRPIYTVDV